MLFWYFSFEWNQPCFTKHVWMWFCCIVVAISVGDGPLFKSKVLLVNQRGRATCKIRKKMLLFPTRRFSALSPPSFLWNKCLLKLCGAFLSLLSHDTALPPFLPVLSAEALIPCSVRYPWPGWLSSSGFVFVMRGQDCVVFDLRCSSLAACSLL